LLSDCINADYARAGSASAGVRERARNVCLSPSFLTGLVLGLDIMFLSVSSLVVWSLYIGIEAPTTIDRYVAATALGTSLAVVIQYLNGQYMQSRLVSLKRQVPRMLLWWGVTLTLMVQLAFALKVTEQFSRVWLFSWFFSGAVLMILSRIATARLLEKFAAAGYVGERIAIYGAGERGQLLRTHLLQHGDAYTHLVGMFDDLAEPSLVEAQADGSLADLLKVAQEGYVDTVILALPWTACDRLWEMIQALEAVAVDVRLCPAPIGTQLPCHDVKRVAAIPMLSLWDRPMRSWHGAAKWMEDKIIALMALVVFGPLMLMIAAAVRLDSKGPVFFRQRRFGFNNEAIEVLKFRTMYTDRQDVSGAARTTRDDPRVTRVGRFLRRSSLDELPQLLNVLKGDMSIVGPRPHAVAMKVGDRYYFEAVKGYAARHRVRPGITGWAQVNDLRGEIDCVEKAEFRVVHDLYYVNHWSLMLDLRIILKTFYSLVSTHNAY
jgi:Undecaprenyl-phosphate glucose phosphotransferase